MGKNKDFQVELLSDKEVRSFLTEEDIREKFDLGYHTKNVEKIFHRVFGNKKLKEKHIIDSYLTKFYNGTVNAEHKITFCIQLCTIYCIALEHVQNIRQKHRNKSLILSIRRSECL